MANIYKGNGLTAGVTIQEKALATALGRLNYDRVVGAAIRNRSADAARQGSRYAQSVIVPVAGDATVVDKTPGSDLTPQLIQDAVSGTITIDKHKVAPFLVEDWGSLFSGNDTGILGENVNNAIAKLGEAIETDIIATAYAGASRLIGAPSAGLDAADLRTIRKYTRVDRWNTNEPSYLFVGPEGEEDLLADAAFTQYLTTGEPAVKSITNAYLGKKFGVSVYSSNLMPSIPNSPGAEHAIALQKDGVSIAFVDMNTEDALPDQIKSLPGVEMVAMTLNTDSNGDPDLDGVPAYSMRMMWSYDHRAMGFLVTLDVIYGVAVTRAAQVYDILY